jgi:curved DNA-binding protein CbpA
MAQFKDYYKILGVPSDAKLEEIKGAFKHLCSSFYDEYPENFNEIIEAYHILKDPIKRKKYDKDTVIEKPKPAVDKIYILFDKVTPGEVKKDSFMLSNIGGDYKDIYVCTQNPNSWLKIVGANSLDPNQSDELPLKVVIEASVDEWGRNYIEYIIVRLDDEEIRVKAELNTKEVFEELENEIDILSKEVKNYQKIEEDYLNKLKEINSDYENYRKGATKEISDIKLEANKNLIYNLSPIIDDLNQALKLGKQLKIEDHDFYKRCVIIFKKLVNILEKNT